MPIHLFIAPAGAGKTQACVDRVRSVSRAQPLAPVWVCLPSAAQATAFRGRLAAAGGALGVEAGTTFDLYRAVLTAAGQILAELEEPLQHRLLRAVIDQAAAAGELQHYGPLRDKPGFLRLLHGLIEELKQAQIEPSRFHGVVRGQGARLEELAGLYGRYQEWLLGEGWMDKEGLGWLAARALERNPALCRGWALVAVDGFDRFNPTQMAVLGLLGQQVQELVVTLTRGPQAGRLVQGRFERTLACLQAQLEVEAEPLAGAHPALAPALAHLEVGLFEPSAPAVEAGEAVACLEAPNRPAEVRAVLRWVKERLVCDGLPAHEVAILARDLSPYIPFLDETAQEYGLPLTLAEGLPLAGNPTVAALMAALSLPRRDRASASVLDGRFPLRETLEAIRSPYLNWRDSEVGLTLEDAALLEQAAQGAQVLAGLEQWREALAMRLERAAGAGEEDRGEGDAPPPESTPQAVWATLSARFERLVRRLTPPAEDTVAGYTAWVEDLIGDEPEAGRNPEDRDPASLQVLAGVRAGGVALAERDIAALRSLKRGLRSLVWAERALDPGGKVPYERFLDELAGVVAASRNGGADRRPGGGVWVAEVHQARGLSFRAVAILGLGEGEFPRPPTVDPLLRESDRRGLVARGLPLDPPDSGEFTLFYEAVTRGRERLLLSRTYLGDDGQPREPSPFWEEALRLFAGQDEVARRRLVTRVRSADPLPLERAASWVELVGGLAQRQRAGELGVGEVAQVLAGQPEAAALWWGVERGAEALDARLRPAAQGLFEGDCAALAGGLAARYAPDHPWSASRLEGYLGCPFSFYLAYALSLPPWAVATAGFDAAQQGSIYHEILEKVYRQARSGHLEELLAALPAVAAEVLEQAPRTHGFRPSQLWEQEKARIRLEIENTLRGLAECSEGWRPRCLELRFGHGEGGPGPQPIAAGEQGEFRLRGIVDRVDCNAAGELRVIDYKSGGTIGYRDLAEGRRIQLALYARAVEQALAAGPVVSGFYWQIRQARRSSLAFEALEGGAAWAMARAAEWAWVAIEGARAGRFSPQPGSQGCPSYCLGREFCWRYAPRPSGGAR